MYIGINWKLSKACTVYRSVIDTLIIEKNGMFAVLLTSNEY